MSEEKCENCKYWFMIGQDNDEGECKRYPPVLDSDGSVPFAAQYWVQCVTYINGWCGEWKPRVELPMAEVPDSPG